MIEPDLALVLGLILVGISVPSALTALAEKRAPRLSAILILLGGAAVLWALQTRPGGYTFSEIPEAFIRVIAQVLN